MIERFCTGDVTILIVEDDESTRMLLRKVAEQMGAAKVMDAADGGEGLRLACETLPTLVVTDLEMAPVDGMSLLAGLRASQNRDAATLPVVMFTAQKEPAAKEKADRLGATAFLVKPFNPKGLSKLLSALAYKRQTDLAAGAIISGGKG